MGQPVFFSSFWVPVRELSRNNLVTAKNQDLAYLSQIRVFLSFSRYLVEGLRIKGYPVDKYEPVNLVEKARAFLSCKKVEEENEEESRQPTPGTLFSSSPLRENEIIRGIRLI